MEKNCDNLSMSIDKGMKKGILKVMVLSYIATKKTYPYALLKKMNEFTSIHAGHSAFGDITKSDMYNIVSSLEKGGFVRSRTQLKGNKVQKMFAITTKGNAVIKNKNRIIGNMIKELTMLVKEEGFDG
jgi:DNA-binding PadR family transcriptional regulator